jgi:hypothetical protein
MRIMTIQEYVLEEFNKMLAAEGRDVRIVRERPKPTLVTDNVMKLEPKHEQQNPS